MGSSAIDGLISGLDTTSLISNLMKLEAAPQNVLRAKQSTSSTMVSALQSLNSKIASLAETAATLAKPVSWSAWTATSSSTSATAKASATAQPGGVTFTVDSIATSQVSVTRAVPDNGSLVPVLPPAVTVKKLDGTYVTVQPTSGTLSDVAKAINDAADAGIRATVVRVSSGGTGEYRIQFTGTTTGSAGTFEVYAGTEAQVTGGTAPRLDEVTAQNAANAQITLWKGIPALERSFSQSSNTFSSLMTGVDVTVSKVTGASDDPVTISVARDSSAVQKQAADLVSSLGITFSEITSRTATTTTTSVDGRTVVTPGLMTGDSAVRGVREQLTSAASLPVNGQSPASVGIVLGRNGTFTFDAAKFASAMAEDPAKVQAIVTTIADRVAKAATTASDKTTGTLTLKVTGQQELVKGYGGQIESWERRLELRRAALEKTYAALEVSLSNLNAQSSWLSSQLDSMNQSSK